MKFLFGTILFTLFFTNNNYNQTADFHIKVKYIPFSAETQIDLHESDISNFKQGGRWIQIKKAIIESDTIAISIIDQLNKIKHKGDKNYNLRMQCIIYSETLAIDSFYVDNKKRLVYKGSAYDKYENVVNLVLSAICRPLYSYFSSKESLYWSDETQPCNDSVEFIKVYGKYLFENTDWEKLKEKSRDLKSRQNTM